ncbi:MAG: hypothetical protein RLZ05_1520 [Bacteroidota bacterium]|jgi:hypothetical protein
MKKKQTFFKNNARNFFCLMWINDIRPPAQVFLLTIVEKTANLRGKCEQLLFNRHKLA